MRIEPPFRAATPDDAPELADRPEALQTLVDLSGARVLQRRGVDVESMG